MSKKKVNSRALRQLAEELVQVLSEEGEIRHDQRDDCTTSLVRQWITYDGHATLFLSEQQVYLHLGKTLLGRPQPIPEPAMPGWRKRLLEDWKIDPDEMPDILDQLNRGQSAEVTNSEGIPLRLWVNPQERSKGIEPLVKQPVPPGLKRDYRKIAANELEQQFGDDMDPEEMEELACSVAHQWQKYEGHACLFIDSDQQLFFKLTEKDDGGCDVVCKHLSIDLEPLLLSLGIATEAIPDVIARINIGQDIEFLDNRGAPSILWHDPKTRKMCVEAVKPVAVQRPSSSPPIFCPKCRAVLKPWRAGERQQTCPNCAHPISFGSG